MKKKFVLFILLVLFYPLSIYAIKIAQYEIKLDNQAVNPYTIGYEKYGYQGVLSRYYEFIDEQGKYNIIYELTNDSAHLGWVVLNSKKEKEKEILIDKSLPMFGNAIYDNGYLYVVTGRTDKTSSPSNATNYPKDYTDTVVLAVTKYNKEGKIVKTLEITGRETSNISEGIVADGTKNLYHLEFGAKIPFDAGNCALAVNNGVIVVSYAKEMYNGHQMSDILFVDGDTLEYLSRPTTMNFKNPYFHVRGGVMGGLKWVSHSFDQRVIVTSDGQYLFADQGDASTRGFVITKTYEGNAGTTIKTFLPFHFRESSAEDPYGYNTTFANMGSLVEVEDGYLFIASSEKTLSINYSNNRYMNEGRNLFIQKYKKNFENQSLETLNMLNTPVRSSEEVRTDKEMNEEFRLPETGVKDYGVKWLTNHSTETTVLGSRGIKLDDNTVAILWAEQAIKNNGSGKYTVVTGTIKYYFEIIDNNGNIIEDKTEIENATLTNLIDYTTDGKYIYWTQKGTENNIILNRLEVDASIELEETSAEVKLGERKKIDARSDSKITWTSSNPSIVSVDNDGNIFAKKFGSAVITISTRSSKVNYIVTVKKSTIQEEMKDFFNTITDSFKATFSQTSFDKMDINRDGKIDVIDVVNYVRLIFIRI